MKAPGFRPTDNALFTQLEQLLGTPASAGPEQAAPGGPDVDALSDIDSPR
jgi:hypothetical protein